MGAGAGAGTGATPGAGVACPEATLGCLGMPAGDALATSSALSAGCTDGLGEGTEAETLLALSSCTFGTAGVDVRAVPLTPWPLVVASVGWAEAGVSAESRWPPT